MPKETIYAKGVKIGIYTDDFKNEFISLTDIARYKSKNPFIVVCNWMRDRETIEFLGLWEELHNPLFKPIEIDRFKNEAGLHSFTMSPEKWISSVNSIGIKVKRGRGGGTFAHSDIAFEFASWISAEFKLYIIKDYRRLKTDENSKLSLNWNLNCEISKINYRVHTDAIKNNLVPPELTSRQIHFTYASEADLLNVALFGMTAKEWRDKNKGKVGNVRDYAEIRQLLVLASIESYNAILINQKKSQSERLILLREMVKSQLKILIDDDSNSLEALYSS